MSTGLVVRTLNGFALTDDENKILSDYLKIKGVSSADSETFFLKIKAGPWYNVNYVTELKRKKN